MLKVFQVVGCKEGNQNRFDKCLPNLGSLSGFKILQYKSPSSV